MIGFAGKCGACGHEWYVIGPENLPMPISSALRLMESAFCPECGNAGQRGSPVNLWICREPQPGAERGTARPKQHPRREG